MVEITAVLSTFVAAVFFGAFFELALAAGTLGILGFIKPLLWRPAFYSLVTLLSTTMMVGTETRVSFLLPAGILGCVRLITGDTFARKGCRWWLITVPPAVLLLSLPDRDIAAVAWLILVATVPLPRFTSVPSNRRSPSRIRVVAFACAIGVVASIFLWPYFSVSPGRTAVLKGGEWAKSDSTPELDQRWNIDAVYSYSELQSLLGGDAISPDDLTSVYTEAWLITPTKPMGSNEIDKLLSWVRRGGHLLVLTDHTDLYGHGRVINQLLNSLSVRTSLTAFFPSKPQATANTSWGESVQLKTSNVQYGQFLWPVVTARWWNEMADYSSKDFFGPLTPSLDDGQGCRIICGTKAVGGGMITLFGDSTIAANFAIYQPGTVDFLAKLRHPSAFSRLLPLLWLLVLLSVAIAAMFGYSELQFALPILGFFSLWNLGASSIVWNDHTWWSGDPSAVYEHGNPEQRISTAYSLAFLSGEKPRWTDNPLSVESGVWVSSTPPPSSTWRWVDLSASEAKNEPYDSDLTPLLDLLNNQVPKTVPASVEPNHVLVGGLWTDDVVGDWWFDRGISISKHHRLRSWISWLQHSSYSYANEPVELDKTELIKYRLVLDGNREYTLELPMIMMPPVGGEAYLGKGVSAEVVKPEDKKLLLGGRPFTEGWGGANAWLLIPDVNGQLQ